MQLACLSSYYKVGLPGVPAAAARHSQRVLVMGYTGSQRKGKGGEDRARPRIYGKDQQCPVAVPTLAAQVRAFLGVADLPLRTMSLPFHARSGASPPIGEGQEAGGGFIHRGEQRGGHRSGAACDAGNRLFLGLRSPVGLGFDARPGEATGGRLLAEASSGHISG